MEACKEKEGREKGRTGAGAGNLRPGPRIGSGRASTCSSRRSPGVYSLCSVHAAPDGLRDGLHVAGAPLIQVQRRTTGLIPLIIISQVNDSRHVKAAMAFLCWTMQACGGMHRKGGEGERTHRGWCCEEGREVGNGREIPTSE